MNEAFSDCDSLNQVTLPDRDGYFVIDIFAFAVGSGPQPLHLRIPNPKMALFLGDGSFIQREVTVYCDPMKAGDIVSAIQNYGLGEVVGIEPYAPAP